MINILAHNILSPLGATSQENLDAILEGNTALTPGQNLFDLPERVCASVFDRAVLSNKADDAGIDPSLTLFEKAAILSATTAIKDAGIDPASDEVIFILSSTKGNVDLLKDDPDDERCYLSTSAERIASHFGNSNTPIVVSNACISGLSAQIIAARLLESGRYSTAVVIGADMLSRFIISGFQSFMALSLKPCLPYDKWRNGLNLGEAVATIIFTTENRPDTKWSIKTFSCHNDANHISGPSRTGEGAFRVLSDLLPHTDRERLAFINAHGTSTLYNDEMESIAIHRAGLDKTPVNGLKGFYGHTLGAAGVVETILSSMALERGLILPTRGYQDQGTTHTLNLSNETRNTDGTDFIKLLSGFGGSNAGILFGRRDSIEIKDHDSEQRSDSTTALLEVVSEITISPSGVSMDGRRVEEGGFSLTELYRKTGWNYPKFFKMDALCRLGFIAAEYLLSPLPTSEKENMAVILFNRSGSLVTDRHYQETINDSTRYFPSPAIFVYTLANIVTGEIAIRHKIFGETAFYILDAENQSLQDEIVASTLQSPSGSHAPMILTGWLEAEDENRYYAHLRLLKPSSLPK